MDEVVPSCHSLRSFCKRLTDPTAARYRAFHTAATSTGGSRVGKSPSNMEGCPEGPSLERTTSMLARLVQILWAPTSSSPYVVQLFLHFLPGNVFPTPSSGMGILLTQACCFTYFPIVCPPKPAAALTVPPRWVFQERFSRGPHRHGPTGAESGEPLLSRKQIKTSFTPSRLPLTSIYRPSRARN